MRVYTLAEARQVREATFHIHAHSRGQQSTGRFTPLCYLNFFLITVNLLVERGWRWKPQCWSAIISESCGCWNGIDISRNVHCWWQSWEMRSGIIRQEHSRQQVKGGYKFIILLMREKKNKTTHNRSRERAIPCHCPFGDSGPCVAMLLPASMSAAVFVFPLKPCWCRLP